MARIAQGDEIINAIITGTKLGIEDHGMMTCMITCEGDHWGQGFGGYGLAVYDKAKDKEIGTAYGMEFVMRILEAVGVENWEDLKGTHVRIDKTHTKVLGIGHILKDQWFYPEDDELLHELLKEEIKLKGGERK